MSVLSGFKKVKNYILTSSGYQLLSRWTSSQTVECNDGKTVEEKVGDINGIAKTYVDIKNATDNSVVASALAVKEGLENSSALISMTQAEYDALSDTEKNDNNMRAIIDTDPDRVDAKNVAFDNTDTGLSATTAQSAIAEVNSKLETVGISCAVASYLNNMKTFRDNHTVTLRIASVIGETCSWNANQTYEIGTITDEKAIPSVSLSFFNMYISTNIMATVQINTSGVVAIIPTTAVANRTNFMFNVTYVAK